jgi:hypothetical protein
MAVVPHPPYSPDLTLCDFFLFPRMKSELKGRRFQDFTEIQEQLLTVLHAISKNSLQLWASCINSEGEYLTGKATSGTKGKRCFVIDSVRKLLDAPS